MDPAYQRLSAAVNKWDATVGSQLYRAVVPVTSSLGARCPHSRYDVPQNCDSLLGQPIGRAMVMKKRPLVAVRRRDMVPPHSASVYAWIVAARVTNWG